MRMLPLVLLLLYPCLRGIRRAPDAHEARRRYRRGAWLLGGGILAAMAGQESLLLLAGQLTWGTALPLHLCSLMGAVTLPALLSRRDSLLHALLYAGAPGALLALLFPAVAQTPWPGWTAFFFHLMHAGIALAPLLPMALGWRPRPVGALQAGAFLLAAGCAAMAANALTGGNYLFLAGAVAGTPLVVMSQWGGRVYRLLLAASAALALAGEAFLCWLWQHRRRA